MAFNPKYVQQFEDVAEIICNKHSNQGGDFIIGTFEECPHPPEAIEEIMNVWVNGIDKLLALIADTENDEYSERYRALYSERGITYEEYYYLFSEYIDENEFLNTPAYIFTKTYSKDLRSRRFQDHTYSPESYKEYILSLDLVPSRFLAKATPACVTVDSFHAHSYCVAKTRSGKTELLKLIIHKLVESKKTNTSILVLDPHGECARELRRLKLMGRNLENFVYLDPTIDDNYSPVFNPFNITDKSIGALAYTTDNILDAFEQLLRDQAVTSNMRRLLRHCIHALLYHDGTTMMDLLTLLQGFSRNRNQKNPEFFPDEEYLINQGKSVPDTLTRKFFEYGWKDVDSRTINAVVERIDGILSHPLVRRFMVGGSGTSSFDLDDYLNTGKIVVVNLDFTKLGNIGSEAIGRLIVSQAQNISAQRNKIPRNKRPRTIIFMDECQRFVSAAIERALSEFAKFNTYLFLAHQYIEQIDDGMSKSMLSNTENKIIGRNSSASMGAIAADVGVPKDDLMEVKRYEFYIKSGDRKAFKFTSSDILLDKEGSQYYNTEEEAKKKIDTYMIENYYQYIGSTTSGERSNTADKPGNQPKAIEASHHRSVQLDNNDF